MYLLTIKVITALCIYITSTVGGTLSQRSERNSLCLTLASKAQEANVDITLVLAIAMEESRVSHSKKNRVGAIGPLQVIPKWYCKKDCDPIDTGIKAIKIWRKLYPNIEEMLCHYNSGYALGPDNCPKKSKWFANRVIKWKNKLDRVRRVVR